MKASSGIAPAFEAIGLVGQDRERRLQRMREIAGLRARAQHHLAVDLDHAVQVVDQRLHFGGESARQARGLAGLDHAQRTAQARHRLQAEADLKRGGGGERKGQESQ